MMCLPSKLFQQLQVDLMEWRVRLLLLLLCVIQPSQLSAILWEAYSHWISLKTLQSMQWQVSSASIHSPAQSLIAVSIAER